MSNHETITTATIEFDADIDNGRIVCCSTLVIETETRTLALPLSEARGWWDLDENTETQTGLVGNDITGWFAADSEWVA